MFFFFIIVFLDIEKEKLVEWWGEGKGSVEIDVYVKFFVFLVSGELGN